MTLQDSYYDCFHFVEAETYVSFSPGNGRTRISAWFHTTPSLTPYTIPSTIWKKKTKTHNSVDPQNYCYFSYYDLVTSTLK